jgi:hypothetical protein
MVAVPFPNSEEGSNMYNALMIGWGAPVRGREQQASRVFGEWVEMLGALQSKGTIKSMTPVFLQPRGGDLRGFFLITGERDKLAQLTGTDEMRKAVARAELIVDNFGVINAITGDEIGKQMQLFVSQANELAK